jgi:hypothetical protein
VKPRSLLLISEPVQVAAIRALPGDAVAGQAPHIFIHAFLAHHESAPAGPAEREFLPAAVADSGIFSASPGQTRFFLYLIIHGGSVTA